MRVLFISSASMMATHIAYRIKQQGHDVKLFIQDPKRRGNFDKLVKKTNDWRQELRWVGKGPHSLIVFDDIGYGKVQDRLRREGYSVFGGSVAADRLEADREFAQSIFAQCGMQTVPIKDFETTRAALAFMRRHKAAWVIKQNGHSAKNVNYVPYFADGRDAVHQLETYQEHLGANIGTITLQQRIEGVEFACGRYFNGKDWVGPIEMNVEHKRMFPGNLGPTTSEMGTLAWYDDDENNKLFCETLAKLKPYLQQIDYRGDVDINAIVNETGAYPLEATPRFGSPIVYLHDEIHTSPWTELLKAIADGRPYNLGWRRGYGIVLLLAVPPFPYTKELREISPKGLTVYLDPALEQQQPAHVYFEGVAARTRRRMREYYVADQQGYVAYVTALEPSIEEARAKTAQLAKQVYVPKMFYRNDIGVDFMAHQRERLRAWGYI